MTLSCSRGALLSLAVFLLCAAPTEDLLAASRFCLAVRGKPASCSILLPKGPTAVQRYAAEELQRFVEKQTGVRLPLAVGGVDRRLANSVVFEDDANHELKEDGFRLRVVGDELRIGAAAERGGPLYGVCELLERFGGCRWYSSWCSRIPRLDRMCVPADLDETHEPAFAMRQTWWYDLLEHHEFAARLRMNTHQWGRMEPKYGGERFRFGGGLFSCHTFEKLVPIERYGKEHPEYFAYRDGKRRNIPDGPIWWYAQLCLTNPDVLELVTRKVLEHIRADPKARFYGVSQNDNPFYCQCEKCAAVDAEEGSHAGTVVRFVNAVAERVEQEFPDVTIETLAYQFSRRPPQKTRLRKNVIPCLCTIECDFARPIAESPNEENRSFLEDIRTWGKMTDGLYVWDYTTDFEHYPMPFANVYSLQDNIRLFRKNGVKCLFSQGAHQGRHADFAELKAWLLAKWMWSPDLPVKGLLDDFFAGYYGKGAPFVREYFEELHRRQRDWSSDPKHPLTIKLGPELPSLSDEFLQRAVGLFQKAQAAVKDDPVRSYNVRMSAFSVDYVRLERLRHANTSGTPEAAALAQSLLTRMNEATDIVLCENTKRNEERRKAWQKIADELDAIPLDRK